MRTRTRVRLFALTIALVALLASVVPAGAITWGQPDNGRHPSTGAMVETYSGVLGAYCSGTLISPTVFLTAAHCGDDGARVQVSFNETIDNSARVYAGTFYGHPLYPGPQDNPYDIAVVVFDKAVKGITPAKLPSAGLLDSMQARGGLTSQQFTSVGYGSQETKTGPGPHELVYLDVREYSVGTFNSLGQAYLRISQNPATGNGGTCYGDSGGPNFLGAGKGETTIIAGITITGDWWCRSTNVTYRLDTQDARDFLGQFVTLP